jgi:spore coat protein U-like protein
VFRKLARTAAIAAALTLSASPARAATATANLTVTATVLSMCTIPTATLAFGNYDPSLGSAVDASVSVAVQCTYNSSYSINMSTGSNASGAIRRMAGPAGEFLTYELYSTAARDAASIWPTAAGPSYTAGTAGTGYTAAPFTVYGRIPGGQIVATGAYTDTVTMTINF